MKPNGWPDALRWREEMFGTPGKSLQPCEKDNVYWMRRAITAARDLEAGHRLAEEDLLWTRPMNGLPPGQEGQLVGRTLARAVKRGEPLLPEQLEKER